MVAICASNAPLIAAESFIGLSMTRRISFACRRRICGGIFVNWSGRSSKTSFSPSKGTTSTNLVTRRVTNSPQSRYCWSTSVGSNMKASLSRRFGHSTEPISTSCSTTSSAGVFSNSLAFQF